MVKKTQHASALLSNDIEAPNAFHHQDQVAAEKFQQTILPLSQIEKRSQDTRPVSESHVAELMGSITVLGLIEPLVVDLKGRLLAGAHRLDAISLLKETSPDIYDQRFSGDLVPVRMMPFDADLDPQMALQVELAENEKRVNYSREQIQQLAVRLRELNYKDIKGRPKQGEKALGPALAVAIGVSTRYVRKVLNEPAPALAKSRNSVPTFGDPKSLKRLQANLKAFLALPQTKSITPQETDLQESVTTLLGKIQACLDRENSSAD